MASPTLCTHGIGAVGATQLQRGPERVGLPGRSRARGPHEAILVRHAPGGLTLSPPSTARVCTPNNITNPVLLVDGLVSCF